MTLYRQHSSGYLAPRWKPAAETAAGTLLLAATLSWLGPAFLDAEDAMPTTAPATEADLLTPAGLAEWRAAHECCNGDCVQVRQCPMRVPAEAATEIGAEPAPRHSDISGEWVLTLIVGLPIALVFGGLLAVALTTH